ncbi:tetratricopeptide repeat protein [Pleurocapsa sp. PCC 7327]|nr:tetratricopeptide repeat protein [Pleurocapsa sp. PCC 7327]
MFISRTTRLKWLYFSIIVVAIGAIVYFFRQQPSLLLATSLLLLVPGRIQGHLWRDFFRGRRLLQRRQCDRALAYFYNFLKRLKEKPILKRAIWLSWAVYSRDIEAMTHNNIGVAYMELGDFKKAKRALLTSISIDPKYPLPFFNLAIVAKMQRDSARARKLLDKSARLGYRQTTVDRLIHLSESLLARVEGRGISEKELPTLP